MKSGWLSFFEGCVAVMFVFVVLLMNHWKTSFFIEDIDDSVLYDLIRDFFHWLGADWPLAGQIASWGWFAALALAVYVFYRNYREWWYGFRYAYTKLHAKLVLKS